MQFRAGKEKDWLEGRANNQDPYGNAVFVFAEKWANLMEEHVKTGKILTGDDIERYDHEACKGMGLSGFMYGCAVACLSDVWIYGEELRRWSNRKEQIQHEGDQANDNGGVLNPALITIEVP